jgi:hypothetical protein
VAADDDEGVIRMADPRLLVTHLARASDVPMAGREASREFFYRDQKGDGLKYLAAKAQFGRPNIPPSLLDDTEVKMLFQTAELASLLPVSDRDKLAEYTDTVQKVVRRQTMEDIDVASGKQPHRSWTIHPIISPYQMRRQTKNGSKDSIMESVPHMLR